MIEGQKWRTPFPIEYGCPIPRPHEYLLQVRFVVVQSPMKCDGLSRTSDEATKQEASVLEVDITPNVCHLITGEKEDHVRS